MLLNFLSLILALNLATALAGKPGIGAMVTTDNPLIAFEAIMPSTFHPADGGIIGSVTAIGSDNGIGVRFQIELASFPDFDEFGPFSESVLHFFLFRNVM